MKILGIPAYFNPEKAASNYLWDNLSDAYVKHGIKRVEICPSPCRGVSDEVRKEYKKKKEEILYDGMLYVRRFYLYKEGKNPVLRALRYFISAVMQLWLGEFYGMAKDCDVLFVTSTPPIQGVVGALLKKWKGVPMIYNLQDIFPDTLVSAGLAKKDGILWKIGRVVENYTYRHADKIVVISEDFKKNIIAKGVPEEKIEVIYNWVDEQAVVDIRREDNVLVDRYKLDRNKFYVTYNGNIGLSQNMDLLMEVAKELEQNNDIHFIIVGNGAYKDQLEKQIMEYAIKNVTLLPFQPYEDISHVFSLGDVSLVISKPGVGANSVPSKTWSIMSASRPVLANFDENELKSIIENNACGIFTKAGDKAALTEAILKLYHNRELGHKMGKNGRDFVMKNLTKDVGTQKYVNVIMSFENRRHE